MGQRSIEGALQPGHVLQGRYQIWGALSISGMGAVYQALDLHFPDVTKLYAVKEMINQATDQDLREQMIRSFECEAETLAALSHPAIPRIHDYFSVGDRAYLVMEYVQGKDLESIMNHSDGLLPVERVHGWAIEICDALHYLHTRQSPIVFGDMKPSNVMIDHRRHVRLIDFGIAKAFQSGQKGAAIGTEGYSPPEQYKGEASPASDIYALGATLHHVLTRCDPRMEKPSSFEDRPIRDFNPDVPEAFAAIVMRVLAPDPEDRFASAEEMKRALEALDLGMPCESAADSQTQGEGEAAISSDGNIIAEDILPIWIFQVKDQIRSSPIVVDDVVYFGGNDQNLWAIDAKTGEQIWEFPTDGGIGSSPSYSDGTIYIGSEDHRLYAVDAETGQERWNFLTNGPIFTAPCVVAGHVYFGSDDGNLYALSAHEGRKVWAWPTDGPVRSSPAVSGETIFFGSDSGDFYALNVPGKRTVWHFRARQGIMSSPLVQDKIVYFGSNDWTLYALDIEAGYPIWRYRTHKQVVSSPRFYDGRIYFGSADGCVYSLDALSGREIWRFETEEQVTSTPFVYNRGLYIGSVDGCLYCLHPETGDLLWRFQSGGEIISSPVVYDDVVYVGSADYKLYALPA